MIQLAANISTLFPELPFLDRLDAAADAGFTAIECQFPYAVDAERVAARLDARQLKWVLLNAPPGGAAERGIACLPGREHEFDAGIETAVKYMTLGACRRLHVMAGLPQPGADRRQSLDQYVNSIARAADRIAALGATVMIEPINTKVDVPGYLLDSTALALECMVRANRANIQLQYDVYHMQIMEGDLLRSLQRLLPHIGHVQIADNPGRHEPGTGEINFERVLSGLDALGYGGYVGCEYIPAEDTHAGLRWAHHYLGGRES
jgi:hydroxypyruvate isomerase